MSDSRAAANQEQRTKNSQNPNLANIMKTKKILALLISGVFATTMASQGAVVIMQVQTTTDNVNNDLQAGWDRVDGGDDANSITGVVDGVTITVDAGFGRTEQNGSRYTDVDHTDGDLDNLLRGGRITNSAATDITLTLEGLADGDYLITTYHHATFDLSDGILDYDVNLTDANGTDVLVHDDLAISHGTSVTTADLAAPVTAFTVSGGNDVSLTFAGVTFTASDMLVLNGFELSAVPEPSSTALLGLGGLALALRRRRS